MLNKILCRDGRFDKTLFHFIAPRKIEDEDSFIKTNNIANLCIKPVDLKKMLIYIKMKYLTQQYDQERLIGEMLSERGYLDQNQLEDIVNSQKKMRPNFMNRPFN